MRSIKTAVLVLWLTFTLIVVFGSSLLKNRVQVLERRLASINTDIQKDISDICADLKGGKAALLLVRTEIFLHSVDWSV